MRRLLSLFFAVALLVIACSKPEPDNPNPTPETPKQETVTLSPGTNTAPVITSAGGSTTVSFTASAAWSASIINTKADSWCSVSPTSGVAGAASITITVKENTTPDNRSASVVITSGTATQTIKVEQKQKDALTVTASSFEVSADGGEIKVATKSNVSFTHSISTDAQSWIKAVETKALKDSTLTFEIAVNESRDGRTGKIYLSSGALNDTVNVYQAGDVPRIVITQKEYILKSEGESFEVEVASNVDATMSMVFPQGVDAWISENTTRALSTNKFYFTAQANETYNSRSALIIFSNTETNLADTVTVNQAQKDAIVVAKSSYNVENEGGAIEIEVGHNVDYEYTISADWITKAETKALVTDKLVFNVAENTSYDNREGTITFTAGNLKQEVKVYQSEKGALIISKTDHVLNSDGGEITLEIQANVEFTVTEPTVDWLHKVNTKGLQTHTLKYTVDPNEDYDSRSTQLYVKNLKTGTQDTLTVSQAQKDAIVLAKSEYEFGLEGGALDFEIQTNVDITVSIPDSCSSWIKQVETRGLETKKLYFNVLSGDTLKEDRTGYITLAGGNITQTIKILQKSNNEELEAEREALIAFYKAAGGDNWTNNTNWCSDKPVKEWYGIQCNSDGFVTGIDLSSNNLSGVITDSIGVFTKLKSFNVSVNTIGGQIPETISELIKLEFLGLAYNKFEGQILNLLGDMHILEYLLLADNNFSGSFPDDCSLPSLRCIELVNNRFSGNLPMFIIELEKKSQDPNSGYTCWIEPQQAGYGFTAAATRAMIDLGNSLYMHPAGIAIEYRMNEIKALQIEDAEAITKNIYNVFGDYFDFIAFLYNVDNMAEISGEIAGQYNAYSNDVSGIGRDIFSASDECGSSGKLKGVLHLSEYRQIKGSFLHEIVHAWAAFDFGQFSMNYDGSVEADPVHWGISSVDGRLGGFKLLSLQRNVDGVPNKYKATCTNADNSFWFYGNHANDKYAPLELYLMGMVPSSDVPNIHYFTGVSGNPQEWIGLNGVFYAENENILTINDIISRFGPRSPDYTKSQKDFRCLVVVVTDNPVDDRRWSLIESDIQEMQKKEESNKLINFYEATGKRGTIVFDGLQSLKK